MTDVCFFSAPKIFFFLGFEVSRITQRFSNIVRFADFTEKRKSPRFIGRIPSVYLSNSISYCGSCLNLYSTRIRGVCTDCRGFCCCVLPLSAPSHLYQESAHSTLSHVSVCTGNHAHTIPTLSLPRISAPKLWGPFRSCRESV